MQKQKSPIILLLMILTIVTGCGSNEVKDGELKVMDPTLKKAELYYDYGTTALVAKDYTKALTNLKKAIELIEDDSRYHNNLGMAYYFKKDFQLAIKHLKRSIRLDEKNSDARNNLASIYFNLKDYDKAKEQYEIVLKDLEYGKQFRTYYNLGLLNLHSKRKNIAVSFFQKSIESNKNYCPSHIQLGRIYFESHNYLLAANSFQNAALGSCADNPTPHFYEALSLQELGEYGKAALKYEEIEEKFPSSKENILAQRKLRSLKAMKLNDSNMLNSVAKKEKNEKSVKKNKKRNASSTDF